MRLGELGPIVHVIVWTEIDVVLSSVIGPLAFVTLVVPEVVVTAPPVGAPTVSRTPFTQPIRTWSPMLYAGDAGRAGAERARHGPVAVVDADRGRPDPAHLAGDAARGSSSSVFFELLEPGMSATATSTRFEQAILTRSPIPKLLVEGEKPVSLQVR